VVTKYNVVLVAIGTISITVVGALLSNVFSPLNETIKDFISPPPHTYIVSAKTFDNSYNKVSKEVKSGDTIPVRSITFTFNSNAQSLGATVFQCIFDGSPFEECISPKPYANLQTEEGHIFKVRAEGILGNTDKSPATFSFTTVTTVSIIR
jgi:hypothetical protein